MIVVPEHMHCNFELVANNSRQFSCDVAVTHRACRPLLILIPQLWQEPSADRPCKCYRLHSRPIAMSKDSGY
jgi:hypothetical protein